MINCILNGKDMIMHLIAGLKSLISIMIMSQFFPKPYWGIDIQKLSQRYKIWIRSLNFYNNIWYKRATICWYIGSCKKDN